jgi:hypothetical protein
MFFRIENYFNGSLIHYEEFDPIILNLVPPKLYPIKEAVPTKESDH